MRESVLRRESYDRQFASEVLSGLAQPQKFISSTWLYDRRGSELFEAITRLPEYYPTRSEIGMLERQLPAFCKGLPAGASVLEIGAGAARKTRLLLSALNAPARYTAIDISSDFLFEAVAGIAEQFPRVHCTPVILDFGDSSELARVGGLLGAEGIRIGFFPGSTIGNLDPEAAVAFLQQIGTVLGRDGLFIVGADATQDEDLLLPAYDDGAGITADFNLNLLVRINRELAGTFRIDHFRHEARYNREQGRIEMHLVSLTTQRVSVLGESFLIRAGESLHTENSYKHSRTRFMELAHRAGWIGRESWGNPMNGFEVHVLSRAAQPRSARP